MAHCDFEQDGSSFHYGFIALYHAAVNIVKEGIEGRRTAREERIALIQALHPKKIE